MIIIRSSIKLILQVLFMKREVIYYIQYILSIEYIYDTYIIIVELYFGLTISIS